MPRPVLSLTTGPSQYRGSLFSADVIQQEYGIDACVLKVPRLNATTSGFDKGTPIQFTYGRSLAQTATFTGYVHHTEGSHQSNESIARVVCLGAAAPVLRDAASRQWPVGSDAATAVQSIADALHLSSITERANIEAPGGPVNESWWRYIVRTAKRCGFTCYVVGTDLRFHSRRINASGDAVPWFQDYDTQIVTFNNVIRSYTIIDSDDEADFYPHRKRRAYGVTDEGLTIRLTDVDDLASAAGVTQDLPTLTRNESMVVHDYGTAQSRLTGMQERNRFTKLSEFVLSGDETITQASTAIMRGISPNLDGYWYVTKAVHRIASDSYSLLVEAGRDGTGDSAPVDLSTPVSVIDLGRQEPSAVPAPTLRTVNPTVNDLVFPTSNAQWTASLIAHREHFPWRAVVRG